MCSIHVKKNRYLKKMLTFEGVPWLKSLTRMPLSRWTEDLEGNLALTRRNPLTLNQGSMLEGGVGGEPKQFDFVCKQEGNSLTVHTDTFSHCSNMLVHHGDIVIVRVNSTKQCAQLAGRGARGPRNSAEPLSIEGKTGLWREPGTGWGGTFYK